RILISAWVGGVRPLVRLRIAASAAAARLLIAVAAEENDRTNDQRDHGDHAKADAQDEHLRAALFLGLLLALGFSLVVTVGRRLRLLLLVALVGLPDLGRLRPFVGLRGFIEIARVLDHEAILALGAVDLLSHEAGILDGDHCLAARALLFEVG